MEKVNLIKNNTAPLCYLPNGTLICYHHGIIVTFKDVTERLRFPLFQDKKEKILKQHMEYDIL